MAVVVIDTIKPKNQGTFPVVEAADVKVTNDKRLDAALNDKASQSDVTALQTAVSGKASQADLNALSSAVSGKASQSDLTALSNTVADKADKSALAETDAAVAGKQAALTEAQIEACNSGITSELAAQITANATAITGKADASDLATLESEVDTKADNSDLATATANLQAQIDNIVTPVTQDAEVQNSRVDAQGVTHTTLKERCDNDDEKHTAYEGNATENLNLLGNELNVEIPLYGRNVSQVATTLYTLVDNVSLSSGVTYRFDFSYDRNIETSDYIYAYIKDSSNASVVSWEFPAGSNGGTKTFTPQSNLQNCTIKFMAAVNKYVGEVKVSRAATPKSRLDNIDDSISTLLYDEDTLTNYGETFDGKYQPYMVNNGVLTADSNSSSYFLEMKDNTEYTIKVIGGSFNRFRIYGTNQTPTSGISPTAIYIAESVHTVTGDSYVYTNDGTYKYLIIFLSYGTSPENANWNFSIFKKEASFATSGYKIKGVPVAMLDNVPTINYKSINYNIINGYIATATNAIVSYDYGRIAKFNVESGLYYKITLNFNHNRFIVYGSSDNNTWTEITRIETESLTNNDSLVVQNTTYKYFAVQMWFSGEGEVPAMTPVILESSANNFANFEIDGVKIALYSDIENIESQIEDVASGYECEVSYIRNSGTITADGRTLCLVCQKQIYSNGKMPDVTGYLYIDERTNRIYYSATNPDNPVYLCDWDSSLAATASGSVTYGAPCYWHFSITKDGDIICLLNYYRCKPILYPHTDYNNPVTIDGLTTNPHGLLTQQSIVQMDDGTFYFGEYCPHSLADEQNNDRRNIWKVTPPYTTAANWVIDHSFKHVYFTSPVSDEPDNEIGHIHSVTFDWYTNTVYANTGDIGRHVRIWRKTLPNGSWTEAAHGTGNGQGTEEEQKFRVVNLIYTEDACWWATDSFKSLHNLYKAERDNNGDIDFTTTTKIINLETFPDRNASNTQATYANVLLRNPNGLLIIDRSETRADHKLDLVFFSFDTEKAYICKTFKKVSSENGLYTMGDKGSEPDRLGLPNQCTIGYQPFNTDYVMIGGGTYIRMNQCDIFNNDPNDYVGALKLKVIQK